MKKLFLAVIATLLLAGTFSYAYAAGVTEEICNLDFNNSRLPTFTYNGNSYTLGNESTTAGHLYLTDDDVVLCGKMGARGVTLKGSWHGANGHRTGFSIPNISSLKDIGGGCIVVSWDEIVKGLSGQTASHVVNVVKKKTSDGTYEVHPMQFYAEKSGDNNNLYFWGWLKSGSGQNGTFLSTGTSVANDEWHHYDMVFYHGTTHVEIYMDGTRILNATSASNTVGSGYTIAGVCGDSSTLLQFTTIRKSAQDNGIICDNLKVRRYDSTETFVPRISEDFSSSSITTLLASVGSGNSWLATDNSTANFAAAAGKYGKASTDTCVSITKVRDVNSASNGMYYRNQGSTANYQHGGKLHITFSMAFDYKNKMVYQFNKFFQIQPSGGTLKELFYLQPGKIVYGSNSVDVGWEGGKWYKFDVYITPGDGSTVKNKATLYMNGKLMFENYDMDDYSFTQIADLRIGQREKVESGYHDNVTYLDDFYYEYIPSGIDPAYPNITFTSNNGSIKLVDTDTVYINGSATAGTVKSAVQVTGVNKKYVVTDWQNFAGNSDDAVSKYIFVRTASDDVYTFPIITGNINRYVEDLSSHTYPASDELRYWTIETGNQGWNAGIRGTRAFVTGLAGKAAGDQSVKHTQGRTARNLTTALVADPNLKYVIELSVLMNDTAAQEKFEWTFSHKDNSSGVVTDTSLAEMLKLWKGNVYAFSSVNTAPIGTYKENQWNKFAIEIDPTTFTADVYQNGTKIATGISIASGSFTGKTMIRLNRIKHLHEGTTDTTTSKWSALDDIKVYLGTYDASADAQTLTAPSYLVDSTINWVAVPAVTTTSTFNSAVTLTNSSRTLIFNDDTMASTTTADGNVVGHNQYLASETPGGAIHYYRIVDQTEKSKVISKTTTYGGNAISVGDSLSTGNYTMNAVYEKYNNTPENIYVILGSVEAGSPEHLREANFTQQAISFGTGETSSVTTNLSNASYKLKAMVWDTNYRALCNMTEY